MIGLKDIRNLIASNYSRVSGRNINKLPHFVPLDLKVLQASIGSLIQDNTESAKGTTAGRPPVINLSSFRNKILNYIRTHYRHTIVLSSTNIVTDGKSNLPIDIIIGNHTPAIVYLNSKSDTNIVGVLYDSYNAAYSSILNDFLNKESLDFLNKAFKTKGKEFDLAFVVRNDETATTTLGSKIKKLFGILNSVSNNTIDVEGLPSSYIDTTKHSVLQTKIIVESLLSSYANRKTIGPLIETTIEKTTTDFLYSIKANILVIQDSTDVAAGHEEVMRSAESVRLSDMLTKTVISSKTFLQSIKDSIISRFTTGKPSKKETIKVKLNPIDLRRKSKISVTTNKGMHEKFTIPPTANLIDIQSIINMSLAETVKKNMGSGNSTDVLNYRKGRLANSYKVTGVSQDRNGAITAFYTYMRYPYGTFGLGGKQQTPRSRDPKLLGDKSIREIAQQRVTGRFRTSLI